jgi:hypothetical protein
MALHILCSTPLRLLLLQLLLIDQQLARAVKTHLLAALPSLVSLVREGLTSRRKAPFCIEALACVADLVEGLGQAMGIYIDGLLEPMFSAGLRYVV